MTPNEAFFYKEKVINVTKQIENRTQFILNVEAGFSLECVYIMTPAWTDFRENKT